MSIICENESICIMMWFAPAVHQLTLPEPAYSGPENIVYIRGSDLEEELANDKKVVWMVEMYTAWNPTCVDFASQFAEISAKYSLDNLKFGKIDLTRNPETAEKYKINTSALSKQLPTLILFRNGKEDMRRPLVASNGALIPFSFVFVSIYTVTFRYSCNVSLISTGKCRIDVRLEQSLHRMQG